jgi:hypothetical protein
MLKMNPLENNSNSTSANITYRRFRLGLAENQLKKSSPATQVMGLRRNTRTLDRIKNMI